MTFTLTTGGSSFWTSPAVGGLGAVIAALILGALAYLSLRSQRKIAENNLEQLRDSLKEQKRIADASLVEVVEQRKSESDHRLMERWWTQWVWLSSDGKTILTPEVRLVMAKALFDEAVRVKSHQLQEAANAMTIDLMVDIMQRGRV